MSLFEETIQTHLRIVLLRKSHKPSERSFRRHVPACPEEHGSEASWAGGREQRAVLPGEHFHDGAAGRGHVTSHQTLVDQTLTELTLRLQRVCIGVADVLDSVSKVCYEINPYMSNCSEVT